MSKHVAKIVWNKSTESFKYPDYNREHDWLFDNDSVVKASASPKFKGKEEYVDPEEAFVAALSSCHMLTFLAICSRQNIIVKSYDDEAEGYLELNNEKKLVLTKVYLNPKVEFETEIDFELLKEIHHQSHNDCFLANSVKTEIEVKIK